MTGDEHDVADDHFRVGLACDAATLSDPAFERCLRTRSLHASFEDPLAAITYWTGQSYYAMFPAQSAGGEEKGEDVEFVFDLYEPVDTDLWKDGCLLKNYPNTIAIRIEFDGTDANHGALHDPPMNGGIIVP